MNVLEIPIEQVKLGEANTRTVDLLEGEDPDTSIQDLALSLRTEGLLNPITVLAHSDGTYECVAGQRRLAAARSLGWATISAQVRSDSGGSDGMVLSLVENLHRADMNPRDKARAFEALVTAAKGDVTTAAIRAHVSSATVRKYVALAALSPDIQAGLAAGEITQTGTLATLARKFPGDFDKQHQVLETLSGFGADTAGQILKRLEPDLGNLDTLRESALEGDFGVKLVQVCPRDCPVIPAGLKPTVRNFLVERGVQAEA
ncbi:MAG: ParB/RepB/Spo0J family partition protein [Candidatus Dormibacteria bacterium]